MPSATRQIEQISSNIASHAFIQTRGVHHKQHKLSTTIMHTKSTTNHGSEHEQHTLSLSRGKIVVLFFWMRHLMPSLGSSAQKMIFLLYGPNFLLFPKEEKEKSCNNLKVGERSLGKRVGYTKGRY